MVLGLPRLILCLVQFRSTVDRDFSSIFPKPFSKKERALSFFPLLVPVQCLNKTFFYLIFSAILKQREKLCNDDINRASVL